MYMKTDEVYTLDSRAHNQCTLSSIATNSMDNATLAYRPVYDPTTLT